MTHEQSVALLEALGVTPHPHERVLFLGGDPALGTSYQRLCIPPAVGDLIWWSTVEQDQVANQIIDDCLRGQRTRFGGRKGGRVTAAEQQTSATAQARAARIRRRHDEWRDRYETRGALVAAIMRHEPCCRATVYSALRLTKLPA